MDSEKTWMGLSLNIVKHWKKEAKSSRKTPTILGVIVHKESVQLHGNNFEQWGEKFKVSPSHGSQERVHFKRQDKCYTFLRKAW
jgi:hypothetical protein